MSTSARIKFDEQTKVILHPDSPDSRSYFGFVQRLLYQYKLNHAYTVQDVMGEAHLRGVSQIQKGKDIYNALAWYKGTSHRIIQEWRRAQDKAEKPLIDPTQDNPLLNSDTLALEEEINILKQAFKSLNYKDQELIRLRIEEGLPWHTIGQHMASNGEEDLSDNALRQKGFRAIKKLRKLYEKIHGGGTADIV